MGLLYYFSEKAVSGITDLPQRQLKSAFQDQVFEGVISNLEYQEILEHHYSLEANFYYYPLCHSFNLVSKWICLYVYVYI